MKILITTDLYTVETNGVVTSTKNLVRELKALGHEVRVLTLSETKLAHVDEAEGIYFVPSMSFAVYPGVRSPLSLHHKFVKEQIAWKPDVIHSQCEYFSYLFANYVSKKTKAPIVHTYHTLYEQYAHYVIPIKCLSGWVVKTFSRKRLKKARVVIAPTHKVEQVLRGYNMKNDIRVVPSGIKLDQHAVRFSAEERANKKQELGIPADRKVLLNLGRLGDEKRVDELIRFYATALKTRDDIHFLIVGGGPAKESLEKLAADLGIADRVLFTGMVNPQEVQLYYQLGDLFLSASTSETQGLTYIEAAANGLPLLCRQDLCLVGVLEEGKNGYEYTDEQSFLAGLDKAFADPAWCEAAGKESEAIAASFGTAEFGNRVAGIYKSILS